MMGTIFDEATKSELIRRIHSLTENSRAGWGKMTVYQMVKHCRLWDEMMQDTHNFKRAFIGRIFGRIALKVVLGNDKPLRPNTPTAPFLVIKEINGELETEKQKWISKVENYSTYDNPGFVHVFFGKMTKEQVGHMAYKHIDHHLRQFNA